VDVNGKFCRKYKETHNKEQYTSKWEGKVVE